MKLSLSRPGEESIAAFLASATGELSYPEVGATALEKPVPGYDNDHHRVRLGEGDACFEAARAALVRWEQFPAGWAFVEPKVPLEPGKRVVMCARAFGLWWMSAAQIVYVTDEPDRFGFAYGTLAAHVECGEERFLLEKLPDSSVWYDLRAFSRPRRWLIRLGYPLARRLQARFAKDSQAALLARR